MSESNGHTPTVEQIYENLLEQTSVGYKPQLPIEGLWSPQGGFPLWNLRIDLEWMLTHPTVRRALGYYKGGIAGAEFWGGSDPTNPDNERGLPISKDPVVSAFILEQCQRFWDRGVPLLQGGYEYGWIAAENKYSIDPADDLLKWESLVQFSPRDSFLLTQDYVPVGVRIKNVRDKGFVDLHFADGAIPSKGLWYAHEPRFNALYGQSQLLGAWRPWRRLAFKDGAETVVDGAVYRLGYQGPIVRYPEKDPQGPSPGAPNTTLDAQGNPRRYSRDIARQIAEQYKAGGSIAFSNARDKDGNYQWDIQLPTSTLSGIADLVGYVKYLKDEITDGIGVPPELLQAAETGSGYSGRAIPMESFLANQQHIADSFLQLFTDQVLRPLVWTNFGRNQQFTVKVRSLLESKRKAGQAGQQGPPDSGMNNSGGNRHDAAAKAWETRRQQGSQQDDMQFSLITDRIRDIARKALAA